MAEPVRPAVAVRSVEGERAHPADADPTDAARADRAPADPGAGEIPATLRRLAEPPRHWRDRLEQATGGALRWPDLGGVRHPRVVMVVIMLGALGVGAGWAALGHHNADGARDVAIDLPMAARSTPTTTTASGSSAATGAGPGTTSSAASPGQPSPAGSTGPATAGPIVVAAAGAVAHPGVYRLASGARVTDLVAAAGGLDPAADADRLNLAAPLQDGERVYVPRRDQAEVPAVATGSGSAAGPGPATGATTSTVPALVDLNTADTGLLDTLPGVGPSTAAAIVAYRTTNGPFRTVDDLGEVRGIGPAKLEQLRPLVKVG